ncbi:DMT family transporter [Pantoea sp.]|uniref:DMT family transporter n=1 Tax=Pantoea sp. TaxID=69393 RepID=UPI0031D81BDC
MNMLFPLIAVLIWSINTIVSKLSAESIDPAAISFYRWLLAFFVLTPFCLPSVWRQRAVVKAHAWRLLLLGLLGMVLYQSLAYYAAHSVSAVMMGILGATIPLLTILLSVLVLRLAPTRGILAGGLLSFVGLVWLVSAGQPARLLEQPLGAGEVMMLAASTSYALYGVLTRRWAIPLSVWHSLYVQIFFGVLLLLPGFLHAPAVTLNARNLPLVLYAGLLASILAPYLWIMGVQRLGASTTSLFMNFVPVFTAVIAVLFLHEQLHAYHWIGGGMTLVGVMLAQRVRTPLRQARPISESEP